MAAIVLQGPNYELWAPVPRQGWWVSKKISLLSETQWPEDLEKRKQGPPGQAQGTALDWLAAGQPLPHDFQGRSQKRKRRLRRVQAPEPSAQGGGIGYTIGIFDRGRRGFPATTLYEVAPQCLAACHQTVMAVGRREWRQEGERLAAPTATTAANLDPIMVFIVSLFPSATMTDDGILHANRASAHDSSRARLAPVGLKVALDRGK
jgi:hypothetical protein